ncbi:MFS transporter [Xenorhabdus stockiae]|uniref:MFS transporter n=1 Tax=Xenorhabdus stockiae TaxID=351614 RepID=UPI003CFB38AF
MIIAGLSKQRNGTIYIGRIMAGVLIGILFSRFLSSILSEIWGWKSIYIISSILMALSGCFFIKKLLDSRKYRKKIQLKIIETFYF